jgi:hypothetical protein
MLMSCHQNAGQCHDRKTANSLFRNVAMLKYLGTTVTNQKCTHDGIKNIVNLGTVCCHSVQNLLSSHLPSKNVKIKICKTIIFPVVLYGCET